jgi:hypothetical protein
MRNLLLTTVLAAGFITANFQNAEAVLASGKTFASPGFVSEYIDSNGTRHYADTQGNYVGTNRRGLDAAGKEAAGSSALFGDGTRIATVPNWTTGYGQ